MPEGSIVMETILFSGQDYHIYSVIAWQRHIEKSPVRSPRFYRYSSLLSLQQTYHPLLIKVNNFCQNDGFSIGWFLGIVKIPQLQVIAMKLTLSFLVMISNSAEPRVAGMRITKSSSGSVRERWGTFLVLRLI